MILEGGEKKERKQEGKERKKTHTQEPVSYTHLTLPTKVNV